MSHTTPTELQALISGEFESRGWEYDMTVGANLVNEIERCGKVDPGVLASTVSGTWLARNGATREQVTAAIERAVGGRIPQPAASVPVTLIVNDNRYQLNMGTGAQITHSQVNVGGPQINVRADSPKADVIDGVAALVQAGLQGDWNASAAQQLSEVIDGRADVSLTDIEAATTEIIKREQPDPGRARQMIESISEQGLGGALAIGITKVIALLAGAAG